MLINYSYSLLHDGLQTLISKSQISPHHHPADTEISWSASILLVFKKLDSCPLITNILL